MRAVFVHGHRFRCDDRGGVYSIGQFPYSAWERYLQCFSELVVVGRSCAIKRGEDAGLTQSSGPRVRFAFVPDPGQSMVRLWGGREARRVLTGVIEDADAVIARLPSTNGRVAMMRALAIGKPVAVEVVGCAWDSYWNYGGWKGRVAAPLVEWLTRRAVGRSRFTLYVTDSFLQRRYPAFGHTAVASNVEILSPQPTVLEARLQRLTTRQERLIFGFIGSLGHRYKGLHTAFEALARVRDRLPPFELRVLGPGNLRPWQALVERHGLSDRVRLCGVLPAGQAVLEWLDDVDVYLHPSLQEGLPRALIEAMSRACPAVGATTGGIPELLERECLHPPGDAVALGALLVSSAADPTWLRRQAERNFMVARRYARDALAERRAAFWHDFAVHVAANKASQVA